MDTQNINSAMRLGGYTAIGGAVTMLIGAALFGASGADLDRALVNNDISGYLTTAGQAGQLLTANLTVWIIGVILLGMAGTAMASLCVQRRLIAQIAMFSYWTGTSVAIVAFVAWLSIVVQIVPQSSPTAVLMTGVVGWFASRADWIATTLLIGFGPALVALAGRGDWVPKWLAWWGFIAAFAGLLAVVALITGGSGLLTYGFLDVPVGISWTIAAGVVLLRRRAQLMKAEVPQNIAAGGQPATLAGMDM